MMVQHNHNIEDESRLGLFLQVQFHSCENGMQGYLVRKRRWLLAKDTFICDFIANLSTSKNMFASLVEAGGKVVRVKPYFTHYRSHRKIVAIGHEISYIGGMNIGKQYANMDKVKNPRRDWKHTISYIHQIKPQDYKASHSLCQFIPDASVLDALKMAAASGVQIELMIPGIKASFFLDPVTNYYSGQLMEYGTKVYKYNGYIHAKTMIIDEELCCIGSVNMDMRSLMVDDEVCGVFYENELVNRYNGIYENDILHCKPYTWEQFLSRNKKEKLMESIFLPFAPLM